MIARSEAPAAAAEVPSPARRLWPANRAGSRPTASARCFTTTATALPLNRPWSWPWRFTPRKIAPDSMPARSRYANSALTRTGLGLVAARDADTPPGALLVRLRPSQVHHHAGPRDHQVLDVQADELAAAKPASEADQEQRAIAQLEQLPGLAAPGRHPGDHRLQVLDERRRFALLRGAQRAADARPDEPHPRVSDRRLVARQLVHLRDRRQMALQRRRLER